ncbi:hypothetical protein F1880_003779 [Penicillium rolfsii]|nr:hypothetical protein F1880_003779 [Penicillium rolfsii]
MARQYLNVLNGIPGAPFPLAGAKGQFFLATDTRFDHAGLSVGRSEPTTRAEVVSKTRSTETGASRDSFSIYHEVIAGSGFHSHDLWIFKVKTDGTHKTVSVTKNFREKDGRDSLNVDAGTAEAASCQLLVVYI